MLTSFFRKSKPINFLMVGIFMAIFYILANFAFPQTEISWKYVAQKSGLLLVYLLLMIIINFIVKRNEVTQRNTYTIILFALFSVMLQPVLQSNNGLIASFFLLLAMRRIISLRSGIAIKKKIFDTALWIGFAFLFSEKTLFFIILPFLGILFYTPQILKNWFIPVIALAVVFVLKTTVSLLLFDTFYNPITHFELSVDFTPYRNLVILIPLSVLLAFSLWVLIYYFLFIKRAGKTLKPSLYLILATLVAGTSVCLTTSKTGEELLFFIIPVCIIGANYFQQKKERWFKETLLITLIILSILMPFFWS